MSLHRLFLVVALACTPALAQQPIVTVPGERTNLGDFKAKLIEYHNCPGAECYTPQIERQIDKAIGFLKEAVSHRKEGENLAIVLDIDETALSTWSVETNDDFEYIPADSNQCIALHCSPAFPATLHLYQEAIKDNVPVFFITGRPESQRKDTEANLKAVGFYKWMNVALRSPESVAAQTVTQYKSGERAKIMDTETYNKKYKIVLNVGDQFSDLVGDHQAEHSVKLPNPFYCLPVIPNGTCDPSGAGIPN